MVESFLINRLSITVSLVIKSVTNLCVRVETADKPVPRPRPRSHPHPHPHPHPRPHRIRAPPKPPGSPTSIIGTAQPVALPVAPPVKFRTHLPPTRSLPRPNPVAIRRHRSDPTPFPAASPQPLRRPPNSWPLPLVQQPQSRPLHRSSRRRLKRGDNRGARPDAHRPLTKLPPLPDHIWLRGRPILQNNAPHFPRTGRRHQRPLATIQEPQQTVQYRTTPQPPAHLQTVAQKPKSSRSVLRSITRDVPHGNDDTALTTSTNIRSNRRVRFAHTVHEMVY